MKREVKWTLRDDGNSTWAHHFRGDYVLYVIDCDGDGTEWSVWTRKQWDAKQDDRAYEPRIAYGNVMEGDDFELGKQIGLAALEAIIEDRKRQEEEYREHPERFPGWKDGRHPHARGSKV